MLQSSLQNNISMGIFKLFKHNLGLLITLVSAFKNQHRYGNGSLMLETD